MLLGIPLALGSWWGLLTFIAITLAIVWGFLDEERLRDNAGFLVGWICGMCSPR